MSNDLSGINKVEFFTACMEKISTDPHKLSEKEQNYILTVAALLMKKFSLDKRHISYVELAYFIILNYSLTFSDYAPLYDFSISFGLYPISFAITKQRLLNFDGIANTLIESKIEQKFKNENIVETYEQKQLRYDILSNITEICFIAPTSFGKSRLILSHIKKHLASNKRYAVIVPTKALLMQTYRDIKALNLEIKIIIHDEMYQQEDDNGFIGVLTQERVFRLMNKHNIFFDYMYIDEAHQLLENDTRSVLLSRVIKLNKKLNPNGVVFYFSPLISEASNITLSDGKSIMEKRICFNLKEPKIFEYLTNNTKCIYNRFVDTFFELSTASSSIFEYMDENKGGKNFIYLYTPKKIQQLAIELSHRKMLIQNSSELRKIVDNLDKYVHPDFYLTECIKRGFLYVHGKLPDNVRDYLLNKFSKIPELTTVVANKVILEGVNLPIDTLFILQGNNLKQKDLINLIGRVNRLNEIFGEKIDLKKLQPSIHFVNSDKYNRTGGNFREKIRLLKKTSFVDEIANPLLKNFKPNKDENLHIKTKNILKDDKIFFSDSLTEIDRLKRKFVELGLSNIYENMDKVLGVLQKKFSKKMFSNISEDTDGFPIMDRFYWLFIADLEEYIIDEEVSRLKNSEALSYYKMFLENRKLSLNEKISREVAYFKKRKNKTAYLYIGASFGEIPYPGDKKARNKVYVDLSTKNDKELINLAIVKQKQEEDFVSFKLFMFFQLMLDYDQMTEKEYEKIVYGTNNKMDILLVKQGLPINLVTKLRNDNQIDNIYLDKNKNIQCKTAFLKYKETLDDFLQFEINRIL